MSLNELNTGTTTICVRVKQHQFRYVKPLLILSVPCGRTLCEQVQIKPQFPIFHRLQYQKLGQIEQQTEHPDEEYEAPRTLRLGLVAQWKADSVPPVNRDESQREYAHCHRHGLKIFAKIYLMKMFEPEIKKFKY